MRETVLDVAARLTSSERQAVYGHPRLHFACTAAMVEAYLLRRGWTAPEGGLLPEDWACIMGLDKLARQAGNLTATGSLHADTLADQAGYARTGEMLSEPTTGTPPCATSRARASHERDLVPTDNHDGTYTYALAGEDNAPTSAPPRRFSIGATWTSVGPPPAVRLANWSSAGAAESQPDGEA